MAKVVSKKGNIEERIIASVGNRSQTKTDRPLSEKDEEKQVEDEMRIRMAKNKNNK